MKKQIIMENDKRNFIEKLGNGRYRVKSYSYIIQGVIFCISLIVDIFFFNSKAAVFTPLFIVVVPVLCCFSLKCELIINTSVWLLFLMLGFLFKHGSCFKHDCFEVTAAYILSFLVICIVTDMAVQTSQAFDEEQKNTKEQRKINASLQAENDAAKNAVQIAEAENRSKSDFLANMSHDIRTPLNAIIGITTLIEHEAESPEKVREYTKKITASGKHLLGIINEVLDMSKIESGKTVLYNAEFSIKDVIEQLDIMFRPQTDDKNQRLVMSLENIQHDMLVGDGVRLLQIMNNIISNSIKYTQSGGTIEISIREVPCFNDGKAGLCFKVKDNGMGMSPEFVEKIFDTFSREKNNDTNSIQGTGLGMAITKNLVELMGGSIEVQSERGKGSCFEVNLEFDIYDLSQEDVKISENNIKDDFKISGMKFLCAEDNELNAEILGELLKMEGAYCKICHDGEEIVHEFEESKTGDYDIILMDVQMPKMNGYEATRRIRKGNHPDSKKIPIIAMTANVFSEDIKKSIDSGMTTHLSKPVNMETLKKSIEHLFSGGGEPIGAEIKFHCLKAEFSA